MFPITLEFENGKNVATVSPACYGFMHRNEWNEWSQSFHLGDWFERWVPRGRRYTTTGVTEETPFGTTSIGVHCNTEGLDSCGGHLFDFCNLTTIWNSGARTPLHVFADSAAKKPAAFSWGETVIYKADEVSSRRKASSLDSFNKSFKLNLTLEKVLTDLEKAIDAKRESILKFKDNGWGQILGVNTVDIPCDRVLFYLMVGRELDGFYTSARPMSFLYYHYIKGMPIMVAFMMSRIVSVQIKGDKVVNTYINAEDNDSCILPSQNFWTGCGARFKNPVSVSWSQESYAEGDGHYRDDDMTPFRMEPDGGTSESFNDSMFSAIFGGKIVRGVLFDRPGGDKASNLVSDVGRAILPQSTLREMHNRHNGCIYYYSFKNALGSEDEADDDEVEVSSCLTVTSGDALIEAVLEKLMEE